VKSILIVDDHPLVREGMKEMLQSVRFDVSTSEGGEAALELCRKRQSAFDLVITDIRMPAMDGFAFAERLRKMYPDAKILMLAGMPLSEEVARARSCGAAGYLSKATPWEDLVEAIRAILSGGEFQEEHIAEERPGNLSPRELEVLKYLALGKTFEEIAIICGVGTETVKTHTKNLRAKLDAPTSIAAVSRAYELGILRP